MTLLLGVNIYGLLYLPYPFLSRREVILLIDHVTFSANIPMSELVLSVIAISLAHHVRRIERYWDYQLLGLLH